MVGARGIHSKGASGHLVFICGKYFRLVSLVYLSSLLQIIMVRNYIRKKLPSLYTKDQLDTAVEAVRSKQMTLCDS